MGIGLRFHGNLDMLFQLLPQLHHRDAPSHAYLAQNGSRRNASQRRDELTTYERLF